MPFATCRRCQAIFIVSDEDEEPSHNRCPYCGQGLQRVTSEEARQHVERRWQEDNPDADRASHPQARSGFTSSWQRG
jgi:uncharacterized protein with PIN domain